MARHAPDVNTLAAHGLGLLQVVGLLQEQGQVVEAAGGEGVIRPEGPLSDHQAAPRQGLSLLKTAVQSAFSQSDDSTSMSFSSAGSEYTTTRSEHVVLRACVCLS